MKKNHLALAAALALTACASPQDQALGKVKSYIETNLHDLVTAAEGIRDNAPAPTATGWSATGDRAKIDAMKAEWKKARVAYERVEGAIAVLFPDLDVSTDERYDGFIATRRDDNLFDGDGATGVHSIERILWSDATPQSVKDFEMGLPNYKAAAFPANEAEARDFKERLTVKLVADARQMHEDFEPLALDTAAAFRGVIGSMEEQLEKTTLAATGEEESRYAQFTLSDMRANVEGGQATYEAFREWIKAEGGTAEDEAIAKGFADIKAKYAAISGDALPPVPASWSSANPSAADQATEFGKLFIHLRDQADPETDGSLVSWMSKGADRLKIPQLPVE